jgi:(S)-2-hydroxyglutarate dehydrogenase
VSDRFDCAVVGGGLLGLATARALLERDPDLRVVVLEKERELALHQSGRNSGVVHAGLYYAPGSLKAALCREGRELLLRFADEYRIPFRQYGKLVVATGEHERPRLEELARRGRANGIVGLREVDREELRELEPHVAAAAGLHVPETGIVDFRRVAAAYGDDVRSRGCEIRFGATVTELAERKGLAVLRLAGGGEVAAAAAAVCAGVHSDRLARASGGRAGGHRIAPFRGRYFTLSARARALVRGLVYPVPDPRFPFLGVHFTPRHDGEVWAGPNAVLALDREGYGRINVRLGDVYALASYPGTWRLARRYPRTGARELWRHLVRRAAVAEMRRYLPELRAEDVLPGPSGIRAQLLARDGSLVDDFVFERRGRVLHVVNAPSPGATASLAIGRRIAAELRAS